MLKESIGRGGAPVSCLFEESLHPRWDDPSCVGAIKVGGMISSLVFILIFSLWGMKWWGINPFCFSNQTKIVRSEKIIDQLISRTKHLLEVFCPSGVQTCWKHKQELALKTFGLLLKMVAQPSDHCEVRPPPRVFIKEKSYFDVENLWTPVSGIFFKQVSKFFSSEDSSPNLLVAIIPQSI